MSGTNTFTKNKFCRPEQVGSQGVYGWSGYTGGLYCPKMMVAALEHLVFFNPQSGIMAGNVNAWGSNTGNTHTYGEGILALSEMACGNLDLFTAGCNSGGMVGSLFTTTADTEIMMIGFSNGGGLAVYAHVMMPKVTKAVAVDYYAGSGSQPVGTTPSWIPHQSGTGELNLKIYTACASPFYQTVAVTTGTVTFMAFAGLTFTSSYAAFYPPPGTSPTNIGFFEYPYIGANGEMYYAVHGLGSTGNCDSNVITGNIHVKVANYPGYLQDVLHWTVAPSPPPAPPLAPGTTYLGSSRRLEEKKGRRALRGKVEKEMDTIDWKDTDFANKEDFETKAVMTAAPQKLDANGGVITDSKMESLTETELEELESATITETLNYWDGMTHR
jgi:hypothetical protein